MITVVTLVGDVGVVRALRMRTLRTAFFQSCLPSVVPFGPVVAEEIAGMTADSSGEPTSEGANTAGGGARETSLAIGVLVPVASDIPHLVRFMPSFE